MKAPRQHPEGRCGSIQCALCYDLTTSRTGRRMAFTDTASQRLALREAARVLYDAMRARGLNHFQAKQQVDEETRDVCCG